MIDKQKTFHSLCSLCKALEVSLSGYCCWKKHPLSARSLEDEHLLHQLTQLHQQSRSTYGIRRLQSSLRDEGCHHGKARISRLMKRAGLCSRHTRRYKCTTMSKHEHPIVPNLLQQNFTASKSNKVWTSDMTYIPTRQGWQYLATVMDLHSRRIIGWSIQSHMKTDLVKDALHMALVQRKPNKQVIVHSDRGVQYASASYQELLTKHKLLCSMSGKGNCYDNAPMESFYHTLKTELMQGKPFQTKEQAANAIFDYIEVFYNRQRKHSSLNYLSPTQFEQLQQLGG